VIVQIHRERVAARLAVVFDRNHLTAFGVVAEAGGVGHANEFVMDERLGDLQRLGHDFTKTVRIRAVRDDEEFAIDETIRAHRERGARQWHRKRFRSDIADFHADSLLLIASSKTARNPMPVCRRCAMPQSEIIVAHSEELTAQMLRRMVETARIAARLADDRTIGRARM